MTARLNHTMENRRKTKKPANEWFCKCWISKVLYNAHRKYWKYLTKRLRTLINGWRCEKFENIKYMYWHLSLNTRRTPDVLDTLNNVYWSSTRITCSRINKKLPKFTFVLYHFCIPIPFSICFVNFNTAANRSRTTAQNETDPIKR